ncbi:hypothetical protein ARMGADRAFT_1087830 [Armillaria gallica]|uniref:CxC1-like cysteine cluster associated with KDZ transposases domain-containing protein n=1 Tax=Armillaria gallica TaxID=47427 RepID=A0A2H3DCF9_ARMGA|nr:hypothetical protein ARMGADRAFT_1087830 [Armillaria gallica]
MTREELQQLHDLCSADVGVDDGWEDDSARFEGIFSGAEQLEISNAGGEFEDVLNEMVRDWEGQKAEKKHAQDRPMVDAYMLWESSHGPQGLDNLEEWKVAEEVPQRYTVSVVDLFWHKEVDASIYPSDEYMTSALVHQGLIPCTPIAHSATISTRTLEVFRRTQLHSPHLSTQAFICMLCDLHQCPYHSYFITQFTIAFNVYTDILSEVNKKVWQALLRDEADYHIKNTCPCCMYKLEGETKLTYCLLFCMDGNDSLKQILWQNAGNDNSKVASKERSLDEGVVGSMTTASAGWRQRAWGIFNETGVFVALCHHGFVLIAADMVRSGELAKYPLAIIKHLLKTLGADLGGGYDISSYFKMLDKNNIYESLSQFLCNNYCQALDILQDQHALQHAMTQQGIDSEEVFHHWLTEERDHLMRLQAEPVEEMLQMEYFEKLVSLFQSEVKLEKARTIWTVNTPKTLASPLQDRTQSIENAHCQAQEKYDCLLNDVHILESKLKIAQWWMPGTVEWSEVRGMVWKRRYRQAVDALEALVVACLFKLTKMNMSETGYKQCKHIAKALQAHSQAVKTAIDNYNTAAAALGTHPSPSQLTWDEVVHYTFLSDFNLLHESQGDIWEKLWAKPIGRLMMDCYFKIQRAKEEIQQLNIEIHCLATYIQDEDCYLCKKIEEYKAIHPATAFQINKHCHSHACFNNRHLCHLI